jgi:hypothetical protein
MMIMTAMNKEVQTRRQRLLAARAECLAQMTDDGRRAFEQHRKQAAAELAKAGQRDCEVAGDSLLAREIKNLIAEAHRLREMAEHKRDIRTALKGLDSALRAVELYGRATGEIKDGRAASVTVNLVTTRDEGIQTAAELLLELANAAEIVRLLERLQQRLNELEPSPDIRKTCLLEAGEYLPVAAPSCHSPGEKSKNEEEKIG